MHTWRINVFLFCGINAEMKKKAELSINKKSYKKRGDTVPIYMQFRISLLYRIILLCRFGEEHVA